MCAWWVCARAADAPINREAVLGHLNVIIRWYRDLSGSAPPPELPSDTIFQSNLQSLSAEAVRLAFQSARATAQLNESAVPRSSPSTQASGTAAPSGGNNRPATEPDYAKMQAGVSQQISDTQSKIDALDKQIAAAPSSQRPSLVSQRASLNGELSLYKAMLESVQKMASFVEASAEGQQGLEGSIDELARSVPEVVGNTGESKATAQSSAAAQIPARSSGLIGQIESLYSELQAVRSIDRLLTETSYVRQTATKLGEPLRDRLRATVQEGQQLGAQADGASAAASPNPPTFQLLTQRFNQLSAALLPLNQELVVLDQSRSTLLEWQGSVSSEWKRALVSLLLRVGSIVMALVLVVILSEVWRRLTFRYIHDMRRRRQFLVLRRWVTSSLIGVVVILGFVSEFSSLATYAGFVTAGIAVALQTVLLSVAAYFFVIGRYGIRTGDRISVAGVTGDVVDVGIVRFYLMELAGTGMDLFPTGRIAVFSNAVLFQATTPLFKQVPGTAYVWHEAVIVLAPGENHQLVQDKFLEAINRIYEGYRQRLQTGEGLPGDQMEIGFQVPAPEAKLQLGDAGLELVIRYPVSLDQASQIDDQITRALFVLISTDEKLRAAISGTPKMRAAVKG